MDVSLNELWELVMDREASPLVCSSLGLGFLEQKGTGA